MLKKGTVMPDLKGVSRNPFKNLGPTVINFLELVKKYLNLMQ